MRAALVLAFALTIPISILSSAASVSSAEALKYRDAASASIERLRKSIPPGPLPDEFSSILETYSRAEKTAEHDRDEAERIYRLALLKSSLYEQRIRSQQPKSDGGEAAAGPASQTQGATTGKESEGGVGQKREPTAGDPPQASPAVSPETVPPTSPAPPPPEAGAATPQTAAGTGPDAEPAVSRLIIGKETVYTARRRESLRLVGAKLGVDWRTIARMNGLDPRKPLEAGQQLRIDTRRIIPKTIRDGIVINIPDRTLYFFRDKKLERTLPVGLGMTTKSALTTWRTPTGKFRITSKVKDPTWFVPPSIQREMKQQGKTVKLKVPPGNRNPLGKYALKTSLSGILIHSTIFPASIYGFSSHGCIRVLPENMERIFHEIKVNTNGEIIYQPVKIALSDDGRVFLEVHRDIYDRYQSLDEVAKNLIVKSNAEKMVDWERVRTSIRNKKGIPEDITLRETPRPVRVGRN